MDNDESNLIEMIKNDLGNILSTRSQISVQMINCLSKENKVRKSYGENGKEFN